MNSICGISSGAEDKTGRRTRAGEAWFGAGAIGIEKALPGAYYCRITAPHGAGVSFVLLV